MFLPETADIMQLETNEFIVGEEERENDEKTKTFVSNWRGSAGSIQSACFN